MAEPIAYLFDSGNFTVEEIVRRELHFFECPKIAHKYSIVRLAHTAPESDARIV